MKKNRLSVLLGLVLVFALALTACSKPAAPATEAQSTDAATTEAGSTDVTPTEPATGGNSDSFSYAIGGDPGNNVNVITTNDRWGLMTVKMVYSPLFMYNAEGIDYFLADSIEASEDGLTYTVKLKEGVKWSDGEDFNADDVLFTYNAMLDEKNTGWGFARLHFDGKPVIIEKVDDYTVTFTLPTVSASAVEMFSKVFIMAEHIYKDTADFTNNDINMNPVGTGPFKLAEYKPGEYLRFEANETYFKGSPKTKQFIYRIIENSNTAKLALQNGEVDAWVATPTDATDLTQNPNLLAHPYEEGRVAYFKLNSWADGLGDQNVRKAIFYALDRTEIMTAAYADPQYFDLAYTFLPNNSTWKNDNVEKYEQDVEKAKQLLADAGVSALNLRLAYTNSDDAQSKMALVIQQQLAQIGINVELIGLDSAAMIATTFKNDHNDYDMFLGGYIMGIDPDAYAPFFVSTGDNYYHFDNQEIDKLFAEGKIEMDEAKRKEIYNKIQELVADEAIQYPFGGNKRILVATKDLKGIEEAKLVPIYTFDDASYLYK